MSRSNGPDGRLVIPLGIANTALVVEDGIAMLYRDGRLQINLKGDRKRNKAYARAAMVETNRLAGEGAITSRQLTAIAEAILAWEAQGDE